MSASAEVIKEGGGRKETTENRQRARADERSGARLVSTILSSPELYDEW
jgi:aspartate/tyrosine/aromatic aminotransferase